MSLSRVVCGAGIDEHMDARCSSIIKPTIQRFWISVGAWLAGAVGTACRGVARRCVGCDRGAVVAGGPGLVNAALGPGRRRRFGACELLAATRAVTSPVVVGILSVHMAQWTRSRSEFPLRMPEFAGTLGFQRGAKHEHVLVRDQMA